ncbi:MULTISPECIES: hypothetical protein [Burkholderia cepacia complex]|uniref:hypothetical protein n=1 Tax=Burkholderia cepacia complex TaxID=87882 RepID=UPI0008471EDA|nr:MULTISPECIES: hypothetical protein [Burkholderia cepacia complex]
MSTTIILSIAVAFLFLEVFLMRLKIKELQQVITSVGKVGLMNLSLLTSHEKISEEDKTKLQEAFNHLQEEQNKGQA